MPPVVVLFQSVESASVVAGRLDGATVAGQPLRAVLTSQSAFHAAAAKADKANVGATSTTDKAGEAAGGGGGDLVPGKTPLDTATNPIATTASGACASAEPLLVLTRNGKKIPVKYAPAKAVPKVPNAQGVVRSYVTQQRLDPVLDGLCFEMVGKLFEYQERLRLRDPTKAKMRRRLVFGLREVRRGIKSGKVKCVVVAPNIDEGHFAGGLDDTVNDIVASGRAAEGCEVLFALSKKKLGKALGKHVRVSAVGIYSMDGAYDIYKKVIKKLAELSD
mmetsp:Transcript_62742/g.107728  ORF Transcript_62742/g.107728 Transcript_62742/m.107728 type:complete len:276 (-) Transcript_62742:325-1152(-)